LEERLDPNYEPNDEEVREYAEWLGMVLPDDAHLLWLAREGLKEPLPAGWKPCKTLDTDSIYFFNFDTGQSSWEHPCDQRYIELFQREKQQTVKTKTPKRLSGRLSSALSVTTEDDDGEGQSKHASEIRRIRGQIEQLRQDISDSRREAETASARATMSEVARRDAENRALLAEEDAALMRQRLSVLGESYAQRRQKMKEELEAATVQLVRAEEERDTAESEVRRLKQEEARKFRVLEREVEQLRARLAVMHSANGAPLQHRPAAKPVSPRSALTGGIM